MANTFTDLDRTLFSDTIISSLEGSTPGFAVANQSIAEPLRFVGQVLTIPYLEDLEAEDTASADWQGLSAEGRLLSVDFDKTVAFKVGDREQIATGQNWVAAGATKAAQALRKSWDKHILGKVTEITNDLGPYALADVIDSLDDLAEKFDELDVPAENRYIVVPAKVKGAMRAALSDRETTWGDSVGMTGLVDEARGIKVYLSNNTLFPTASAVTCMAGTEGEGMAAVVQVSPEDVEIQRDPAPNAFGFLVKVRALGGAKVYNPERMVKVAYTL
jgi:hypothetical protein